ncbi:MAG: beta-ketoacyl synthase N-terminal-like domain-containing protein [Bacteroidota bacterium]
MAQSINKKDIAIIGMSGVFPKSANIDELWNHLLNGDELIHFYSEEELQQLGIKQTTEQQVFASSHLEHGDTFDHSFFGFTSEEAFYMDPQIRKFFEHAWLAIEDAGYDITSLEERVGVFAAASDNLNWRAYTNFAKPKSINPFFLGQISNKNYMNTLLSYKLNLRGPSYYVNTACSSSLVAIHLACRNLLLRECSMAIAGASRITTTTEVGYTYQPGMIFSKDGHCKAFDANASGTISGEGVGVVVLKRLEDALNDKDPIYAVIKASSTNNDGAHKIGFTAPSVEGQYECIRQAHHVAKIEPNTISFVETHGTGTDLGDSIEIESLNKAFGFNTEKHCAIGSVKSNMGHLDAAAGVSGLIKAALTIKHRVLPASLHFEKANENINFDQGPFYVNTSNMRFDSNIVLRGAVSSFGMGGTNAHVLLEEPPEQQQISEDSPFELIIFSAKTEEALYEYERTIVDFLGAHNEVHIPDIAYTYATGRAQFDHRATLLLANQEIVQTKMNTLSKSKHPNLVFLFSGQGSQYKKMGAYLYKNEPFFSAILDVGFNLIKQETGEDFKPILYHEDAVIDEHLSQTKYTQPLLFLFEYALARLLMDWGIQPSSMMGHSLGEYTAACLSGVFQFEDALRLMIKRGELMNQAVSGAMLAIKEPLANVQEFLNDRLDIAAINTADSVVISGSNRAIAELKTILEEKQIHSLVLPTSHAFHSQSMDPLLDSFKTALRSLSLSEPTIPFISNVTGTFITNEMAISPEYWAEHLRNTVLFAKGVDTLFENKDITFVEIGPGAALLGMVQQQAKIREIEARTFQTIKRSKEIDEANKLIASLLGNLWLIGVPIDWNAYFSDKNCHKVSVPGYPFEKNKFPSRVDPLHRYKVQMETVEEEIPASMELPMTRRAVVNNYVAPTNEVEVTLVNMWKDFFKVDTVGINDNYFELGGDSLQAIVLIDQINKEFDTSLSLENLYEALTIKEVAGLLNFSLMQLHPKEILNQDNDEVIL